MAPRNKVKLQIVWDFTAFAKKCLGTAHVGHLISHDATTLISSGANSPSLSESRVTAGDNASFVFAAAEAHSSSLPERTVTTGTSVVALHTRSPTTRTVVKSSEILPLSLAASVDKSLNAGPALTRSNPTSAIHVKVPSADALKLEGSMLYKDEKGDWVVDLVPENVAEIDTPSGTQMMGDTIDWSTPTMG